MTTEQASPVTAGEGVNEEAVETLARVFAIGDAVRLDQVGDRIRQWYLDRAQLALEEAAPLLRPSDVPHVVTQVREQIAGDGVWAEVATERARAHAKHGKTSMEEQPVDDLLRLAILMEEVGEVAKEFNEARHTWTLDLAALRKELIQTAAMAGAWADAIGAAIARWSEAS